MEKTEEEEEEGISSVNFFHTNGKFVLYLVNGKDGGSKSTKNWLERLERESTVFTSRSSSTVEPDGKDGCFSTRPSPTGEKPQVDRQMRACVCVSLVTYLACRCRVCIVSLFSFLCLPAGDFGSSRSTFFLFATSNPLDTLGYEEKERKKERKKKEEEVPW